MSDERPNDPADDRDHEHDPECAECAQLLSLFVGARLSRDADPRFRELLRGCSRCRDEYRQSILQTAALAKSMRETRERRAVERDARKRKRRRVHNAVLASGLSKRQRRFYLQLMVVPALLLWALNRVDQEQPAPIVASIEWQGGGVSAAGSLLDGDVPERPLAVGDMVVLRAGAKARIEDGGAVLQLDGAGHWLVEPEGSRYRLFAGRATINAVSRTHVVTGEAIVTLEPGTRATVSAGRGPLEVDCASGRAEVSTASASVTLGPGDAFPPRTAGH